MMVPFRFSQESADTFSISGQGARAAETVRAYYRRHMPQRIRMVLKASVYFLTALPDFAVLF